jgi:peptide/nickel transport system substrate-binding protein/oligopeptide transport system substrate-binding protein
MVNSASAMADPVERIKIFQDAEKLMVEEAPAVWIYHRTVADVLKPYVKGEALEPNVGGFSGIQWPGVSAFSNNLSTLYMDSTVSELRPTPPTV